MYRMVSPLSIHFPTMNNQPPTLLKKPNGLFPSFLFNIIVIYLFIIIIIIIIIYLLIY